MPLLHEDNVLSHRSAAVLHGLPLPRGVLTHVEVIREHTAKGRRGPVVHRRNAPLGPQDAATMDGLRVTSLERTAVDLARTLPYEWGVIACDAALHSGGRRERMEAEVDSGRGRQGNGVARRVVAFADGRAESPAESLSRVQMQRVGLPMPELQYRVLLDGTVVARTDFAWLDQRVVGEVDGRIKYDQLLAPGETAADVVLAEKRREESIRQAGYWLVRWGWAEACRPQVLGARIRRAFVLAPR